MVGGPRVGWPAAHAVRGVCVMTRLSTLQRAAAALLCVAVITSMVPAVADDPPTMQEAAQLGQAGEWHDAVAAWHQIVEAEPDNLWNVAYKYIWAEEEYEIVRENQKLRMLQFSVVQKRGEKKQVLDPRCTLEVIEIKPKKKKAKKKDADEEKVERPRAKLQLEMRKLPKERMLHLLEKILAKYRADYGEL